MAEGLEFTRLRAVMSAEGNESVGRIIAETFDDTTHLFIDAIHECLPEISRATIVWRCHFLLGALYYTLVSPNRITRLSQDRANGEDRGVAVEQIVAAHVAALQASEVPRSSDHFKTRDLPPGTDQLARARESRRKEPTGARSGK